VIRALAIAVAAGGALTPPAAAAQAARYATLTVSTTQTYDNNLFAGSEDDRARDWIARVGPKLEVGLPLADLGVVARYGFDAEGYLDHSSLNRAMARQDGGVELGYRPARRLTLNLIGSYLSTHAPQELNVDSGLTTGRARAERTTGGSTVSYNLTPVTTGFTGYLFTRDVLEGGTSAAVHEVELGVDRRRTPARATRVEYRGRMFEFSDGRAELWHLLTARWTRDLTRRTSVELTAGPRVAQGTVLPEIEAVLRRQFQKGELSAGYLQTQTTSIGETGVIDVQRVSGSVVYQMARRVTLTATPAFASNSRDGERISTYTFDLDAVGETRRGLSVLVSLRLGSQQGTLSGSGRDIPYARLSFGLSATLPHSGSVRSQ
jgi:hypothetical protein